MHVQYSRMNTQLEPQGLFLVPWVDRVETVVFRVIMTGHGGWA